VKKDLRKVSPKFVFIGSRLFEGTRKCLKALYAFGQRHIVPFSESTKCLYPKAGTKCLEALYVPSDLSSIISPLAN
jgi:hypothetical protein